MSDSKVVLVTGAASGIGRELATELFSRGHSVAAADVNEQGLADLIDDLGGGERLEALPFDVRDAARWEAGVERVIARWGRLDVLLNVAGYLVPRWAHETSAADVGLTIDINVKGLMFGSNAAARRMIAQGSGHIINVASIAALVPVPGLSVYSASKHAVRAFSIAAGEELRQHGVYVTVVCPGPVATPMLDAQLAHDEAAMTFSAPRPLDPREVTLAIIDRAMVLKPRELTITVPRSGQAPIARLVGALPELATWLRPVITRIGRHNQARLRARG